MMLDPTTKIEKTTKSLSFFTINIYDFPGKYDFKDATPEEIQSIQKCGSVIYVIDVQVKLYFELFSLLKCKWEYSLDKRMITFMNLLAILSNA